MLTMMDQAILAVHHDQKVMGNIYPDASTYGDLFEFVGSGVSRRAYRSSEDGNVYKVGTAGVNYDEHLAFKWFARNFNSIATPQLAERMVWPTVHSFRFANGYGVNVMPYFLHERKVLQGTFKELKELGYAPYCWTHSFDYTECNCVLEVTPKWQSEVVKIFSQMGCMDFDLGRNAFCVNDGEQIVPIDLGYWGLSEAWGDKNQRSEPWLQKN